MRRKDRLKSILLIFMCVVLSCAIKAQEVLHVEGKTIVDGNDEEIILKGIGLGGWMLQEPYMLRASGVIVNQQDFRRKIAALIGRQKTEYFYQKWLENGTQKADIDSLKAWGFNSVRLPMHYNLFTLPVEREPVKGENTWLNKGFEMVDELLEWCEQDSIYLILDLHAAPGGQGHDLPIADRDPALPTLWESEENQKKTVALWKKLAERYKDEKWIGGYDLLNETNISFKDMDNPTKSSGGDNAPLWSLLKEITETIRSVGDQHLIFIEGNGWANNYVGFPGVWDDNMAISFHKYQYPGDKGNTREEIQGYLDLRDQYQVPLWLGEAGENNNEWYRDAVQLMEDHQIGWSWWPLKKIGKNNPLEVKMPEGYKDILKYWRGQQKKPSVEAAYEALLQLAENHKIENTVIHDDVIKALIERD